MLRPPLSALRLAHLVGTQGRARERQGCLRATCETLGEEMKPLRSSGALGAGLLLGNLVLSVKMDVASTLAES